MGIFDSFLKDLNEERKRACNEVYRRGRANDFPVKLVEPSTGRIVEFQITEQDDFIAKLYMRKLTTYAKCLERYGVDYKVTDKTVQLTFADIDTADDARKAWKR